VRPLLPLLAAEDDAAADHRPWRPLHLHLAAWTVLQAAGDGGAAAFVGGAQSLITNAQALIARGSAHIPDAALRQSFLQRPEHRALMVPVSIMPTPR
jgi:hypothetical protein